MGYMKWICERLYVNNDRNDVVMIRIDEWLKISV